MKFKSLTTCQFIAKAQAAHGIDKYNYSLVRYTSSKQKIKIICSKHGVFSQSPDHHLMGQGCRSCASTGRLKSATTLLAELTEEDRASIISRYKAGEGSSAIGKAYGTSWSTVLRLLGKASEVVREGSYAHRTKTLRESAFETLTPESSYWIGFLMADGHVRYRSPTTAVIGLVLQAKDRGHIEKYRAFLGSSHKIHRDEASCISAGAQHQFGLTVSSLKMVKDLERYGLGINKTFTARVENEELAASPHFWRGVIDGDGSIGTGRNERAVLHLIGTLDLLTQFQSFIKFYYPSVAANPRKAGKVFQLAIECRAAEAIIRVLYAQAPLSLDRKQAIADCIMARSAELLNRRCKHCQKPIEETKNRRTIYCSAKCRVSADSEKTRIAMPDCF